MANLNTRYNPNSACPIDKRYVYTTSGALMSVHETGGKRRDILYANGEAIAEIDQDGNIYELHNGQLGTPRYITAGNAQKDAARGQLAGQQAFGPYGEEMDGTFNTSNGQTQTLPTGYAPITGYTGHLNEDLTGLIYMKGRYYSPLWHRFINSDQGVDPNSINQYAYVGGRPFMAKDPSGMEIYTFRCYDGRVLTVESANAEIGLEERRKIQNDFCGEASETVVINGGGLWSSFFGGMFGRPTPANVAGGKEEEGVRGARNGQQETQKEVREKYLELYKQWAKLQGELKTDFRFPGLITGFWKSVGMDLPDCIDFSDTLANWLNANNPFPGNTWAVSEPTPNNWHYNVTIYMQGYNGAPVTIDKFDPYWAAWWRRF